MSRAHGFEATIVRALQAGVGALPRPLARGFGAGVGDLARLLGLRSAVARDNLALAFPESDARERAAILAAHYRDLGMMIAEYARPEETVRAPEGVVVAAVRGVHHLEWAQRQGRGAVLLTGHYGNFGLLAATLAKRNPVDLAGKPIANPAVESLLVEIGARVGLGRIRFDRGARSVFRALEQNRWVMLMADQDAGRAGAFVPFFGRASSTWTGPASIALRTGAPLVMAFIRRLADRRHEIEVLPPLPVPDRSDAGAEAALTAVHTAELERHVRRHPAMWFWLHRRWKTAPPPQVAAPAAGAPGEDQALAGAS